MNQYDSQVARGLLEAEGYQVVSEDEENQTLKGADSQIAGNLGAPGVDVVLMNTCSVREHAEDRVYGRLGMLGKEKKSHPNLVIGLMGCMVEEHKEKLFKRFPQLDFMVGTRNIKEIPALIEEVWHYRKQVARIKQDGLSIEYTEFIKRTSPFHAWLPIMTGCDKVCTFCIVPITRGSEVSMPAREVYREASRLAGEGVKWITLLGQNVNSYHGETLSAGAPEHQSTRKLTGDGCAGAPVTFPKLLDMLCQIEGLEMISFTTSHPHDATEELFQVIAKNPKISRRFHLPLQSGSDRVLKRMKRLHTYQAYKAKIDRLRMLVPDIAITSDIITGFPGETERDHEATVNALKEIRFDGAYIYKYSVRPGTPAAKLGDDIPRSVKAIRLRELLNLQSQITEKIHRSWIGNSARVFIEELNPKNSLQLKGRLSQDKKVVFEGSPQWVGSFREIEITGLHHETFLGKEKRLETGLGGVGVDLTSPPQTAWKNR
ncbi:MAG: tRNA (N6-isopentenyl adenosine(37)-C2)-methylthiotransferase MiaB [Candidatus Omnitrophica bacterium]|nr:tRNA (N6-isopentenyl adenosine(37)-C2)-methylthiotransferase MiaB [Candidatus Omnitrophota bacterium]